MAHKVTVTQPERVVTKSDLVFYIYKDGEKLGEMTVSKGNVEWWPFKSRKIKYRLSWSKLDRLFQEHGTKLRLD